MSLTCALLDKNAYSGSCEARDDTLLQFNVTRPTDVTEWAGVWSADAWIESFRIVLRKIARSQC